MQSDISTDEALDYLIRELVDRHAAEIRAMASAVSPDDDEALQP